MQGGGRGKSSGAEHSQQQVRASNQAAQDRWIQVLTLLNNLSELGQARLHLWASISSNVKWAIVLVVSCK